jgi:hypothetical protein
VAPYAVNSKPFARASLIMIGLAWTLPFLQPYHRFPLTGFYSEWLAFALGLSAALALLQRQSPPEAELPVVALAPLGLALVLGVQAVLGMVVYVEQALTAALYLSWAALIIVVGHRLCRALGMEHLAVTLAWWSTAGGILSAAAGLLQHFHPAGVPGLISSRALPGIYGNIGQANHFATYLVIAIAGSLYLHGSGRLAGKWMTACAVVLLPALALSGSRSAWLYLAVFAAFAGALWRSGGPGARRFGVAALSLLPAFLAAHWLVSSLGAPSSAAAPVVTSGERIFEVATGAGLRVQLLGGAWRMFIEAPVLGAGFGQFAWHHFVHAGGDASIDPSVYRHAHNLVLHLMAETGAIGGLLVGGALLAWLVGLRGVPLDLEWSWLLGVLAILGIHSLLEFPLWYAYFLGIAALLLGVGARRTIAVRAAGAFRTIAAIAIAWGGFNLAAVLPPYREFERLVFLPQAGTMRPADDAGFGAAMTGIYREPVLVPYVELAIAFGLKVDEDNLDEKLALARRAAHFAPVPVVAARYAMLLAMAGNREQALLQIDRTLRVYPAEAAGLVRELEDLARRHPGRFEPLLESARGVARAQRRSKP